MLMNTKETLKKMEEITELYVRELDRYDMEQLTRKPSEDEWSLGQMYMHLIRAALFMQLRHVDTFKAQSEQIEAANGEAGSESLSGGDTPGEKTEAGQAVFAQGSLPPVRIRVPASPEYTPPQPESKEQLAEGLRQVFSKMRELEPVLADISPVFTAPHPAFGHLNATEWFAIVEMHYRHHLRQKERLDALLMQV
ncbi:DinB family protein [Brevibacillus borstelensis]|jgi:hypothetical protein